MPDIALREYMDADEVAWLRCRALSFLGTAYFDDVVTSKPRAGLLAELVAEADRGIVGVLDLALEGDLATIDTIAVHPDHQGRGVGTALLEAAMPRAAEVGASTIEAWTRDDDQALAWYRARGFTESDHYLHVYADYYANPAEPDRAVEFRTGLLPMKVFLHVALEHEEEMRQQFSRVHVCRRFAQPV